MSSEVAIIAANLRARQAAAQAEVERRAEAMRGRIPLAVARLRAEFGAGRVWLFGSFAAGRVHAESDVDLAAEGVLPQDEWRAGATLEDILEGPVDFVRWESAPESLRARILVEGLPL